MVVVVVIIMIIVLPVVVVVGLLFFVLPVAVVVVVVVVLPLLLSFLLLLLRLPTLSLTFVVLNSFPQGYVEQLARSSETICIVSVSIAQRADIAASQPRLFYKRNSIPKLL